MPEAKDSRNHASARPDVRFVLADGRNVDVPAWRWILHNQARLPPRMPLFEFLRLLPPWVLKEVEASAAVMEQASSEVELVENSSATVLTLYHLALWSDDPIGSLALGVSEVVACVEALRAACAIEFQRRQGLLRVHVRGEDRLDRPPGIELELNPLVFDALKALRVAPAAGSPEFTAFLAKVLPLALNSEWADRKSLDDDSFLPRGATAQVRG